MVFLLHHNQLPFKVSANIFFPKAKKYHLSVDVVVFFTVILRVVLQSSFSNFFFFL